MHGIISVLVFPLSGLPVVSLIFRAHIISILDFVVLVSFILNDTFFRVFYQERQKLKLVTKNAAVDEATVLKQFHKWRDANPFEEFRYHRLVTVESSPVVEVSVSFLTLCDLFEVLIFQKVWLFLTWAN